MLCDEIHATTLVSMCSTASALMITEKIGIQYTCKEVRKEYENKGVEMDGMAQRSVQKENGKASKVHRRTDWRNKRQVWHESLSESLYQKKDHLDLGCGRRGAALP